MFDVFIVNFEQFSQNDLLFDLLTLSKRKIIRVILVIFKYFYSIYVS